MAGKWSQWCRPRSYIHLIPLNITNISHCLPRSPEWQETCLPSPCHASEWGSPKTLLSTSCLWLQFPSCFHPPPAPLHPYAPFNRHPLLLPSSFLPPLPRVRGSSLPTMDLLAYPTLLK